MSHLPCHNCPQMGKVKGISRHRKGLKRKYHQTTRQLVIRVLNQNTAAVVSTAIDNVETNSASTDVPFENCHGTSSGKRSACPSKETNGCVSPAFCSTPDFASVSNTVFQSPDAGNILKDSPADNSDSFCYDCDSKGEQVPNYNPCRSPIYARHPKLPHRTKMFHYFPKQFFSTGHLSTTVFPVAILLVGRRIVFPLLEISLSPIL